jgi:hypothetical protein
MNLFTKYHQDWDDEGIQHDGFGGHRSITPRYTLGKLFYNEKK